MIKKMIVLMLTMAVMVGCNIKKTEKGELPDVDVDLDVDADAGSLPEYDVDWADVNVGTKTETVEIPKVVVVMEEKEVEVPYLDIDMPDGGDKEERTLLIEAEVSDKEHEIKIQEIWATGKRLIVVSELKSTGKSIGDKKMRISDQVTLNAADLDVRHYVIGVKPGRLFNRQHTYVNSISDLKNKIGDYKVIYSK